MTQKERFSAALERKPIIGRVPTFELVFFLTMEKFARVHPSQLRYDQWNQMTELERNLHRNYVVDTHIMIAEEYEHDAIFYQPAIGDKEEIKRQLTMLREKTNNKYYVTMHGDPTYGIPDGDGMYDFAYKMMDSPEKLKSEASKRIDDATKNAEYFMNTGLIDGYTLCSDYCFNVGPFISPNQFSEFITPYLYEIIKRYREMGYYTIKHTDGNIMPILDQLMQCNPHGLHSIDPQAGVDIAHVKKLYGDQVCLIGNVHCGLMQTGTDEETIQSARYALQSGMPGYGYIFSTSNCVYTGMDLRRYDLILDVLKNEGVYE